MADGFTSVTNVWLGLEVVVFGASIGAPAGLSASHDNLGERKVQSHYALSTLACIERKNLTQGSA